MRYRVLFAEFRAGRSCIPASSSTTTSRLANKAVTTLTCRRVGGAAGRKTGTRYREIGVIQSSWTKGTHVDTRRR
jgi:hypothetical protein